MVTHLVAFHFSRETSERQKKSLRSESVTRRRGLFSCVSCDPPQPQPRGRFATWKKKEKEKPRSGIARRGMSDTRRLNNRTFILFQGLERKKQNSKSQNSSRNKSIGEICDRPDFSKKKSREQKRKKSATLALNGRFPYLRGGGADFSSIRWSRTTYGRRSRASRCRR